MQDKLASDENHKKMRKIFRDLVDQCLNRPPSAEDANSIAGEYALPLCLVWHQSMGALSHSSMHMAAQQ